MHDLLHQIVICLDQDFKPFGQRNRSNDWGPDCSCNCKHFVKLLNNNDWGVCSNQNSPRKALLTFEHQGCKAFEMEENE
jgi:hypothetical protein